MAIHRFERLQRLRITPETCWKFFSAPSNLARITPPSLGFEILSPLPDEIYEGLMIAYRVRPLAGIPVTWVTEITRSRPLHYFCDEQRMGPYRLWHHEHFFTPEENGVIAVRDLIHYALPFAPFSELLHPWLVQPRLEEIFAFRSRVLAEQFEEI